MTMTDMPQYKDDDFVYVDPITRKVVGFVEWTQDGAPKSRTFEAPVLPEAEEQKKENDTKDKRPRGKKPSARRHYPWGTYRSMKRIYRLEGKVKDNVETNATLETILPKALEQAFWD